MSQIAYLGTGLLGSAFVEAAAKRGDRITVWNRTESKARALEQFGVRVASSPADAVRGATSVHLVLTDDDVVDDVIAALRPGLSPDAIILDHSTNLPARTAARARELNGQGVKYLHCPVFIGPPAARAGKGTVLASGPRALFDARKDELSRMAERLEYFGERPDLAAVWKLCGNAFFIGLTGLVADVFAIARGADAPPADALTILELFNGSALVAARGKTMLAGEVSSPNFELSMARKDVRLMLETADSVPLAVLPGIAARMDALIADGHGSEDAAVLGAESALAGR
jgi:3-hydroxyisobutyrate dehydrogenase-like beta-hydroxyacid dehydrogenase